MNADNIPIVAHGSRGRAPGGGAAARYTVTHLKRRLAKPAAELDRPEWVVKCLELRCPPNRGGRRRNPFRANSRYMNQSRSHETHSHSIGFGNRRQGVQTVKVPRSPVYVGKWSSILESRSVETDTLSTPCWI